VVAKVRERLAVNIQRSHRFHMERFSLNELNQVEGKENFCVEVSNRFAALEDLDAQVEIQHQGFSSHHLDAVTPQGLYSIGSPRPSCATCTHHGILRIAGFSGVVHHHHSFLDSTSSQWFITH
jgi:hypothetical protein